MQIITNLSKSNSHLTALKKLIEDSDEIVICSGWMKWCGLKEVLPTIDAAISRGARITIYTNAKHTGKTCISNLQRRPSLCHFNVTYPYLHTKLYYGSRDGRFNAIFGSANITSGGLWKNEEFSQMVSGPTQDALYGQFTAYITRLSGLLAR